MRHRHSRLPAERAGQYDRGSSAPRFSIAAAVLFVVCAIAAVLAQTAGLFQALWAITPPALTVHVCGMMLIGAAAIAWRRRRRTHSDMPLRLAIREPTQTEARRTGREARSGPDLFARAAQPMRQRRGIDKGTLTRSSLEVRAKLSGELIEELLTRTETGTALISSEATILTASEALPRLLGRASVADLMGGALGAVLNVHDAGARHFCDETLRQGAFACDLEASAPSGRPLWIEANGVASVLNGSPCVMALFRDISSRKVAEADLRRTCDSLSAALEVARKENDAKFAFVAKMNHELRTPLNGILGLSEMLRHTASGRLVPGAEIRRFCDSLHRSGTHLLDVVEDLLDLSRLVSGNWMLDLTEVDLRADIDAVLGALSPIAQSKRVSLENACPPGLEWVVDRRGLRQVIINLAENAVKFSPAGSHVRITVTASPAEMALQVTDQGPGIPDGEREQVLNPFGRGSFALGHRMDGAGLGLSIVSRLMALHGGSLAIDSKADCGSTFTATFPLSIRTPNSFRIAAE